MKVCNFFLLLTCLALTPSRISSNFLFYGSNGAALNSYGNEVCPREEDMNFIDQEENGSSLTSNVSESQNFAVGSPAMSIDEILDISSSHPLEQFQGGLLWENGQAVVEGIEEIVESMVETVQEDFAPMIQKAEEFFVVVSLEDFEQELNVVVDEECVEEEKVGKAPKADATEEEETAEQQQIDPVAAVENASTPAASIREVEREKVMRMINNVISVGFIGSLSLAYLAVASIVYVIFEAYLEEENDAQLKQYFNEILTQLRKERRPKAARKTLTLRKALPAPKKPLALPAPTPKKVQDAQTDAWPLDGECSSETNVSMEDISQSCA